MYITQDQSNVTGKASIKIIHGYFQSICNNIQIGLLLKSICIHIWIFFSEKTTYLYLYPDTFKSICICIGILLEYPCPSLTSYLTYRSAMPYTSALSCTLWYAFHLCYDLRHTLHLCYVLHPAFYIAPSTIPYILLYLTHFTIPYTSTLSYTLHYTLHPLISYTLCHKLHPLLYFTPYAIGYILHYTSHLLYILYQPLCLTSIPCCNSPVFLLSTLFSPLYFALKLLI